MSRSGYTEDCDDTWGHIRWRGAVTSAIRGKRGQAFLREMLVAMAALPEKKLVAHEFEASGDVCALGAVTKARNVDVSDIDPEDYEVNREIAAILSIPFSLACEIMFANDELGRAVETPAERYIRMRAWINRRLIEWDTP